VLSIFELVSVVLAGFASIISLLVWNGQRKLQRENNELQRATSQLAKKQLEMLALEESQKDSARLTLELENVGKGYKFFITNIGTGDAYDVCFKLILDKEQASPLIASEVNEMFPFKKLSPDGETISLTADLNPDSPTAYNAVLSWRNSKDQFVEEEIYVSL